MYLRTGAGIARVDGLDAVLSERKAQGRNLNQLTTQAKMGRLTVLRSDELIGKYADLCAAHGLRVLEKLEKYPKKKRMKPGEYQAGLRPDSWKLDLIQVINEALEYVGDRESFIEFMENEGYQETWTDTRKHITFTCPNGWKCRDSGLHDETFLKKIWRHCSADRQAVGFQPGSVEPDEGWMGDLASGFLRLGRETERSEDLPHLPTSPTWTASKQRRREALKNLAMGQKLTGDTHSQSMSMSKGIFMASIKKLDTRNSKSLSAAAAVLTAERSAGPRPSQSRRQWEAEESRRGGGV